MSETDFDINNYTVADLLQILNIQNEVPITKEKIVETTQEFIDADNFKDNEKFVKFFLEIRRKLSNEVESQREDYEKNMEKKLLYLKNYGSLTDPLGDLKSADVKNLEQQQRPMDKYPTAENIIFNTPQNLFENRINRNTTKKRIVINSAYRTILDPSSVSLSFISTGDSSDNCITYPSNKQSQLETPSNFNVNLSEPITNVYELELQKVIIPNEWYVFCPAFGTSSFTIIRSSVTTTIDIEAGNYRSNTLMTEINNKLLSNSITDVLFVFSESTNKVKITNNNGGDIELKWYNPTTPQCGQSGNGSKVDYNLGWLMGFRETKTTISSSHTASGAANIDTFGTRYVYLCIEDFLSCKPNSDIVSNATNKASYKLPYYYVKSTMCEDADVIVDPKEKRSDCGRRFASPDLLSNLTQKQRYTIDQIKLAMTGDSVDRYDTPTPTDVIAQIPVQREDNALFGETVYSSNDGLDKRIYFGPVNLKKFHIRLLDDRGMEIDMNNMDWSFTLIATQLYRN